MKLPKSLTTHLSHMSIHRNMVIKPCAKVSIVLEEPPTLIEAVVTLDAVAVATSR